MSCNYTRQLKKRGKGSDLYPLKKSVTTAQQTNKPKAKDDSNFTVIKHFENSSPSSSSDSASADHVTHTNGGNMFVEENLSPGQDLDLEFESHNDITLLNSAMFQGSNNISIGSPFGSELFSEFPVKGSLGLGHPILEPLAGTLTFMHPQLVSALMESYFSDTVYGVAPIVRKSSLLSSRNPRHCTPALLYSYLLVSAYATNHPLIRATPTTRETIIAKLTDLVTSSVLPIRHSLEEGCLDDVITYIHLGIVESASEFKGASMRWWHAAWGLARILRLNSENPSLDEERREEQRRTFWLLFLVDRHLALCYNRPLFLSESECKDLYLPISEQKWSGSEELTPAESDVSRLKGPLYQINGVGLFGMYLPLMTVLGGIIELRFLQLSKSLVSDFEVLELLRNSYEPKINKLEESIEKLPSGNNDIRLRAWKDYCRCLVHIFHILLRGFWDPIDLLDSVGMLINDSTFDSCARHSISAAKCIEKILISDPELRLIPYFFGIQLLQAGFLLLCMADRLEYSTNVEIRAACENIIRAHEVCIATMNTEYQRNFRQILRGTINSSIPGMETDLEESRKQRREILGLYRWNEGGTGLAI